MHLSQANTLGALFGEETMKAKLQEVIYRFIRRGLSKMYNISVLALWGLGLFAQIVSRRKNGHCGRGFRKNCLRSLSLSLSGKVAQQFFSFAFRQETLAHH